MNRVEYLAQGIKQQTESVDLQKIERIDQMLDVLNEWNAQHNLTRIREKKEQCIYLIFDALSGISFFKQAKKVLDVGTGAGFPGIPLAICLPEVEFHLNDVNAKKMAYLKHLKGRLKLDNVVLHHQSVETVKMNDLDIITARAVAQPKELHKMTKHLIHQTLKYVLYVSEKTANENRGQTSQLFVPDATRDVYMLVQSNQDLQD